MSLPRRIPFAIPLTLSAALLYAGAAVSAGNASSLDPSGVSATQSPRGDVVQVYASESVPDDPLVREIDDTILSIDTALDGYILGYLESVRLNESELRPIVDKLERTVARERADDPGTYKRIPEEIHLLQAKVRFLQSAHPEFQDGRFPDAVKAQFAKLGELERQLKDEQN